jgi:hypothetical protein
VNSDQIQNSAVAPKERRQKSAIGVIFPSMAMFLQQMILNPKMAYAVKHARFPMNAPFCDFIMAHKDTSKGILTQHNYSFCNPVARAKAYLCFHKTVI